MEEDKQYFLGQINFTGNDSTRDKVIRREIYMNEGDVFNTEALKMSIKRINQLGYFKQMEGAPDIKPSEDADNKVDVTFKVEEQNRNQFTFGGGVCGLEGTFLNASLLDHELPRRRRDLPDLRPDRQAHEELLALGQRALLPRPADHRRRRPLQAEDHLPAATTTSSGYTQESTGVEPRHRLPRRQVVAGVPELHVRGHQDQRGRAPRTSTHELDLRRLRRRRPVRPGVRPAPLRRLRPAHARAGSRRTSSTTPSTTRSRRARACGTR